MKVICIKAESGDYLTVGNEYEVIKEGLHTITVKCDLGVPFYYSKNKFKTMDIPFKCNLEPSNDVEPLTPIRLIDVLAIGLEGEIWLSERHIVKIKRDGGFTIAKRNVTDITRITVLGDELFEKQELY